MPKKGFTVPIDSWLKNELKPYVDRANQKAGWNFNLTKPEPGQFTVYDEGQYYDWHVDSNYDVYKKGDDWNGLMRKLSVTVNLTNPRNYKGGNLKFDMGPHHPKRYHTCTEIRPRGSVIVFPSHLYHQVTPVTEGTRYSLVMWNLGRPFV